MVEDARVVIHCDLDAFYCQVEHRRLAIPQDVPLAVQQWQGLIAVNYPARARGIKRHATAQEALRLCPEIRLVHVQTIDENGVVVEGDEDRDASSLAQGRDRGSEKVSLERYRRASREVMAVISRVVGPRCPIERASIDEAYVDVTALVEDAVAGLHPEALQADDAGALDNFGSHVLAGPLRADLEHDRRLAVGAWLASRIRGTMREELSFTCSAGISHNRLLSKIGSAMHKPNQQTVVPARAVDGLMRDMPLKKISGLGGKLGDVLASLGCSTAGEVQALPEGALTRVMDAATAAWVARAVRGVGGSEVREKGAPKSMLAAKSFQATNDRGDVARWLRVLSRELAERILDDHDRHHRWPKNLVLQYRRLGGAGGPDGRSRRGPFPREATEGVEESALCGIIADAAWATFQRHCAADAFPCTRLALSTTEFVERNQVPTAMARFLSTGAGRGAEGGTAMVGAPSAPLREEPRSGPAVASTIKGPTAKRKASEALERFLVKPAAPGAGRRAGGEGGGEPGHGGAAGASWGSAGHGRAHELAGEPEGGDGGGRGSGVVEAGHVPASTPQSGGGGPVVERLREGAAHGMSREDEASLLAEVFGSESPPARAPRSSGHESAGRPWRREEGTGAEEGTGGESGDDSMHGSEQGADSEEEFWESLGAVETVVEGGAPYGAEERDGPVAARTEGAPGAVEGEEGEGEADGVEQSLGCVERDGSLAGADEEVLMLAAELGVDLDEQRRLLELANKGALTAVATNASSGPRAGGGGRTGVARGRGARGRAPRGRAGAAGQQRLSALWKRGGAE